MLFGNDSGWTNNILGRRHLARSRRNSGAVDVRGARGVDLMKRERYVRFDNHIDAELVAAVAKQFDELVARDEECSDLGAGVPAAHRYLREPNQKIPDLHRLLTDEVAATIRAYYGSNFRVRSIRAYRNQSLDDEVLNLDVFGNLWHMDPELVCDLRYFVYLSPTVTVEQGALELMGVDAARRVTRTGYIRRNKVVGPARRYLADQSRGSAIDGSRGTAVLIDAQRCLHRAGVPAKGELRDMVQFWITPSHQPMSADWGTTVKDPAWSGMQYAAGGG
jgi:hypothetical protein